LNEVLEEADGLSAHKIGITDKSPSGDNINILLNIVTQKNTTRRQNNATDNTEKKAYKNASMK